MDMCQNDVATRHDKATFNKIYILSNILFICFNLEH